MGRKVRRGQDLFFNDFAKVFAKLIELGVYRDETGIARADKMKAYSAEYKSAPKKSDEPGAPGAGKDGEADPLAKQNKAAHAKAKL